MLGIIGDRVFLIHEYVVDYYDVDDNNNIVCDILNML